METGTVADQVRRALVAARVAAGTGDRDEYETLLGRAAADGAGALPMGLELIGSPDPIERETGCDLLGDASDRHEAVRAGTATALVALAAQESEGSVLCSLARALGSTCEPRAVPVLVALAGHPDAEVRLQVAVAFAGVITGLPDGPDIHALIGLSSDEDPEVRNWATFTLGCQAEVDSRAIRSALWGRTTDENADVREEGIHGLARRHDSRAIPLLLELLGSNEGAHVLTFSAAQIMGVPELLPALLEYEPDGVGVSDAVNACDPVRRAQLHADAWDLVSTLHRLRPDLDAAVHMERFEGGLTLGLRATCGASRYDVEALLDRADGAPPRAAELVLADLTGGHRDDA